MMTSLKMTLAVFVLAFSLSSFAWAELCINSVYPNIGELGKDLSVRILGQDFDENTRVSISLDIGNRRQIIGSVDTPGRAYGVTVQGQIAYVADYEDGLQIVDVSDPRNPAWLGSVDTPGFAYGVVVLDQITYVAVADGGLQIVDVSDSRNPVIVGSVDTSGYAMDLAISGYYCYLAGGSAGLQIVDVSDPLNPDVVSSVDTPDIAQSVAVVGNIAYVADDGSGLQIVDVSDPKNPAIVGFADTPSYAQDVAVQNQTAYVADYHYGLQIVDVSVPQHPSIVGSVDTPGQAFGVAVLDQTAFVAAHSSSLQVIDVSDPANPFIAGSVDTPGYARDLFLLDQTAFVADDRGGLQIIDVRNPQNSHLFGSVDTPGYAMDVTVMGQIAYVADAGDGLQVIDVSDPFNPSIIGSVDTSGSAPSVIVMGQIAYVADGWAGLQIVDVSDPLNPAIIGAVDTPEYANRLAVLDQTAYVADYGGGLQIVDVSDSRNPVILGSVDTPGDALDVAILNQTAYVVDNDKHLLYIDVSEPQNPVILGSLALPNDVFAESVTLSDQTLYLAAYYLAADFDGIEIIDVSDPINPAIVGSANTTGQAQKVDVQDQIAYVALREGNVEAIDVSDPKNPSIIGSVDTIGSANGVTVLDQIAYVVNGDAGLTIVPVPREISPVQLIDAGELQATLPGTSFAGHYNIRVFNQTESCELAGAVSVLETEDYLNLLNKKAIVAAGGTGDPSDRLVVATRKCANYAYRTLMTQGYARENIQFLAPHADWDVDGDGLLNDVDDVCTTATLSSAIIGWASDAGELIVFLVDHGGVGTFYANAGDIVHASDVDSWLDIAQESIPGKAVLIYDACHSGSFLEHMDPPQGKERIVIASSQADEAAWFMNDGTLSFSYQFWASVLFNPNLYESFVDAKNMMLPENTDRPPQTALLDANGDGVQSKQDVELARDFIIGRGWVAASMPPEIGEVSEEQVLSETSLASIQASNITALNEIERVWAVIVPPDFDSSAGAEVTDLDTVELTDPDQDGVYVGAYDRFVQPGTYDVFVYASDDFGAFSLPKATTVVVIDPGEEQVVYVHSSGDCGVGREPCYDTVQQGLDETGTSGFLLKIAQGDYYGNITAANDRLYKLSGGYDSGYAIQNGLSAIIGSLTISDGTLVMENLSIAGP